MAQVYSQNIVGYVNVDVTASQFALIANPLDTTDNTLGGVLTTAAGVQDFDNYYQWTGSGYNIATYSFGAWDNPTIPFAPGGGGFYLSGASHTLTFVGEVMTGSLSNPIPAGFSVVSSQVPEAGDADTLGLSPALADFDNVYSWNGTSFSIATKTFGSWDTGSAPAIGVGQAVFVNSAAGGTWTRDFNP
jgi:hypothetical protein